jgi:hypothetical protein
VTGLAFVYVAMLVFFADPSGRAPSAYSAPLISHPVYRGLYASAALLIGIGTTFYHASLTFWGQTADVFGMYLLATFLVLYNLARSTRVSPALAARLYLVGNTLLVALLVGVPAARRWAVGVLILAALLLEVAARRGEAVVMRTRLFMLAVCSLALGFFVWVLDITRTLCAPYSWLQGHAVWHLAGAAAVWLVFLYYRSATPEVHS